jgi:hypothetical protein
LPPMRNKAISSIVSPIPSRLSYPFLSLKKNLNQFSLFIIIIIFLVFFIFLDNRKNRTSSQFLTEMDQTQ